jgi:hypothetical protein
MANRITPTMMHRSLTLLRASLPIDTGNLRYNATKPGYTYNGFTLRTGGDTAPYFATLDGTGRSAQYQGSFEELSFTPVFRYLETALKGQFGGGRFLQQYGVQKYTSRLNDKVEAQRAVNVVERANLAERMRG